MIRLPPTSISLSANDMKSHLQQIDVYHGLLKQGFKKKDILKYLRDQRSSLQNDAQSSGSDVSLRAPTWTDLALRKDEYASGSRGQLDTKEVDIPQDSADGPGGVDTADNRHELGNARHPKSVPVNLYAEYRQASCPSSLESDQPQTGTSQRSSSAESANKYHAPRRSSLLRFSKNASPTEEEATALTSLIPFSPRSVVRYRLRTETYSYEQSTPEDKSSSSSLADVFDNLVLDESLVPDTTPVGKQSQLRGDAEEFAPHGSPARFSATPRARRLSGSLSLERGDDTGLDMQEPCTSRIVPALRTKEEVDDSLNSDESLSPPLVATGASRVGAVRSYLSPASPILPSTPASGQVHRIQTEPRRRRHRYLDGPSFVPYNDSLPASVQPQTPADLSHQPLVDESVAAYTAPPGRLRQNDGSPWQAGSRQTDPGEQSPTTRAIGIRQRRNREFARGTRVEGLRINRTRRGRTRPQEERDEEDEVGDEARDFWLDGGHNNLWRDDLDADRVGEENFETLERPDPPEIGMRVVSGNRRASGI